MKAKTRKIVAKRFKITKSGKILRRRQGLRHLKAGKSKSQKQRMKNVVEVNSSFSSKIRKMLPYV